MTCASAGTTFRSAAIFETVTNSSQTSPLCGTTSCTHPVDVPSDTVKLPCIYCGRKKTLRVRAGIWWKCPSCGKRNPGATMLGDLARQAISAGQLVVGKHSQKRRPAASAVDRAVPAAAQKVEAPPAATTIGRRGDRTRDVGAGARPATPKPKTVKAPPPVKPDDGAPSPSLGRRLLQVGRELLV